MEGLEARGEASGYLESVASIGSRKEDPTRIRYLLPPFQRNEKVQTREYVLALRLYHVLCLSPPLKVSLRLRNLVLEDQ